MTQNFQPDRRAYKFDWRMLTGVFVMVAIQGLIGIGIIKTEMAEITRRMERVEQKIDDKMLTRDEFEKRHEDLRKQFEDLRQRVQALEFDSIGKKK